MLENVGRAQAATSPPRTNVEYVTVRLAALQGGEIGVSLEETLFDEEEFALLSRELASSRVASLDDALNFVRASVAFH